MASENVVCGRAWNSEQQCEFLNELAQRYRDWAVTPLTRRFIEDRTYKLLIVDSIMNLFRESM